MKVEDRYRDLSARSYGRYRYNEGPSVLEYTTTLKEHIPVFRGTPKMIVEILTPNKVVDDKKAKEIANKNYCKFTTVNLDHQSTIVTCFTTLASICANSDIFTEFFVDPKKVGKKK